MKCIILISVAYIDDFDFFTEVYVRRQININKDVNLNKKIMLIILSLNFRILYYPARKHLYIVFTWAILISLI